jgi:ABC-type antimicrobial peptide transport system permease subunit
VTKGRAFETGETNARVAVVDAGYAKQSSLALGDTLTIGETDFEIIGISESATAPANVYVPLKRAQDLADAADHVNQIYVRADDSGQIAQVEKEILGAFPGVTVTTAQNLADQVNGSLSSASGIAAALGKWLAIAALVAAVAVASLLTLSGVSRRVREFGTLKAIGFRSRRIVAQVMGESFVQGIAGGAAGAALGYAITLLIARLTPALEATTSMAGQSSSGGGGGGGRLASVAQTVTVSLEPPVSLSLLAVAIGLAVAGALVAGGIGGWRAARLSPAVALRRVD